MEIIPGIHRVSLPIPALPSGEKPSGVLSAVNIYLIEGQAGWVLVDTGLDIPSFLEIIGDALRRSGISFTDISKIIITHAHIDHFGLAEKLKELSGAKLYIHELETTYFSQTGFRCREIMDAMTSFLQSNGYPEKEIRQIQQLPSETIPYFSPAFPDAFAYFTGIGFPDVVLQENEAIRVGDFNFKILWTPGHSPGHICLYERQKRIFLSGDHILPYITPVIVLNPYSRANPLEDYIQSLHRVKNLRVDLILPGHGDCDMDFQQRVQELLQHHNERLGEILDVLKKRAKTVYDISSELTWMHEHNRMALSDLDPWARRLAFMETLGHLRFLEEKRQVKRQARRELLFYSTP